MSILYATAVKDIRRNIHEPSSANSRWTDNEIGEEINRAIKRVARKLKYPTRLSTITGDSVAKQQEYTMEAGVIEVIEVTYEAKLLDQTTWRQAQYRNKSVDGAMIYQTPDSWYPRFQKTLGFVPIPSVTGDEIKYYNAYEPADISSGDNMPYELDSINELAILRATIGLLAPNFKDEALYFKNDLNEALHDAGIDVRNAEGRDYVRYIDWD